MKKTTQYFFALFSLVIFLVSCGGDSKVKTDKKNKVSIPVTYSYSVAIEKVTDNYLAPALQSFVSATNNGDWLLFAGRTNGENHDGGLHNLNADYSLVSFPPISFNQHIYTFNPTTGNKSHLTYLNMLDTIKAMAKGTNGESAEIQAACNKVATLLAQNGNTFICSNPQTVQVEDYLYVVGGYGVPNGVKPTKTNYQTFDKIAKINVPLLMQITNGDWSLTATEWEDLFKFGNNPTLRATGGELKYLDGKFYLASGHNFNNNEQVYLNCVYQFNFSADATSLALTATVSDTISDISSVELANNPKKADSTSVFRRRDLPIVASLYIDQSNKLAPNLALMGGVFQYHFAAWNDAIYITPNGTSDYYIDKTHNQKNCNIYSCPDFTVYDTPSNELHTFLPGGIGNGRADDNLSGFTNTLGYSKYNIITKTSSFDTIPKAFPASSDFFGAEAEFFPTNNVKYISISGTDTEVIDGEQTCTSSTPVHIGYIYGGIQAFEDSPSTYGSGKSGASHQVWKVILTRTANNN